MTKTKSVRRLMSMLNITNENVLVYRVRNIFLSNNKNRSTLADQNILERAP
jgi:hypothetical protein